MLDVQRNIMINDYQTPPTTKQYWKNKDKNVKRVNWDIPETILSGVTSIAELEGKNKREIVIKAIKEYLEKNGINSIDITEYKLKKPKNKLKLKEKTIKTIKPKRESKNKEIKLCKVEGCTNKHSTKGYCGKHYQQMRRFGKIFDHKYPNKNYERVNEIIKLRDEDKKKFKDIAEILGITRQRVHQIYQKEKLNK
jgi:hypothetical protein